MNFEKVKDYLESSGPLDTEPLRGCVVYKNGKLIYRYVGGMRDIESQNKASGNEICWIYSCTKVLTALATMILIDRGLISAEDKVSDYIPEFGNMKLINGSTAKNSILIKHLLTMSSGIRYELAGAELDVLKKKTEGRCPTLEVAKAIASRSLSFEAGTEFYYGLGHDVAGAVIEVVTGKKYYEFLKENIFTPLGMEDTYMNVSDDIKGRMATQYTYSTANGFSSAFQQNNFVFGREYESGGAGALTTLDDYGKLANMLALGGVTPNGDRIISREAIEYMRTPALDENYQKSFAQTGWREKGCDYGFGVYTVVDTQKPKTKATLHTFGWDGAAGSFVSADPEQKIAIFYFQQVLGRKLVEHFKLREAIYDALLD